MNPSLITGNTLVDTSTAGVAGAAASSPIWLPWLHSVSETAALIAPILGVIWLVVQIITKTKEALKK